MSKIIDVCEFRAHNIKDNHMTTAKVEIVSPTCIYYITYYGERSTRYRSLEEAKADIKDCWGKWHDFKMLI